MEIHLHFPEEKALMDMHIHIRIDLQHPFFHHIRFIFPTVFPGSNNLTVQIGEAYLVIIDQIKGPTPLRTSASQTYPPTPPIPKNSHS